MSFFNRIAFYLFLFVSSSLLLNDSLQALEKRKDFVVFTPPKCGTHLIGKALQLMLHEEPLYCLTDLGTIEQALNTIQSAKEQNQFVVAHNFSSELIEILVKKGYRIIFILRDPRDQVISMMNFMKRGQWSNYQVAHLTDQNEMLEELITGSRFGFKCYDGCIKRRLARVLPLSTKIVHVIRFENLVGIKGGGTQKLQQKELLNLSDFLKFNMTLGQVQAVGDAMFGGTWSFHEGKIGKWKEYFQPYHKELYKILYGKTLIQLGYEKNLDW